MAVTLSIRNVPDDLAARLRYRARRSHRSVQGELLAILDGALLPRPRLTAREVLASVREMGLATPNEASAWIRADRDRR